MKRFLLNGLIPYVISMVVFYIIFALVYFVLADTVEEFFIVLSSLLVLKFILVASILGYIIYLISDA